VAGSGRATAVVIAVAVAMLAGWGGAARAARPAAPGSGAYVGHYYEGMVFRGDGGPTKSVGYALTLPDDLAAEDAPDYFYAVQSVWDNAGSYDQLGVINENGSWGLTYFTASGCATSYSGQNFAVHLQRGATYRFEMSVGTTGYVEFRAWNGTSTTAFWRAYVHTGASRLDAAEVYECGGEYFPDLTDYVEVYETPGPSVPYDFTFASNEVGGAPDTSWGSWEGFGTNHYRTGDNVTVWSEPFYFLPPNGMDTIPIGSAEETTFTVSLGLLRPSANVSLSLYSVPAGWDAWVTPDSGAAPYTATVHVDVLVGAPGGSYEVGVNATNGSANYTRTAVVIEMGALEQVTFRQTGVPSGAPWSVFFDNQLRWTTGASISFSAPNGEYFYAVTNVTNHTETGVPMVGHLAVSGSPVTERLAFAPADPRRAG
jgi:hypothetical protein